MSGTVRTLLVLGCSALLACGSEVGAGSGDAAGQPHVAIARPGLCDRAGDDAVRDVFCGPNAPDIRGLDDLQTQLGLVFDPAELGPADQPGIGPVYQPGSIDTYDPELAPGSIDTYDPELALVLQSASTALSARFVSTINPRAIVLGRTTALAFNRGVQQVELLSRDRADDIPNFYLLRFEQACNTAGGGCASGDLYTPRIERDWTTVRVEDDEDLKNTPSDCRQCHQRTGDRAILLMRELDGPWTHFFAPDNDLYKGAQEPSGLDAVRTYYAAKGDEPYANLPWEAIRATAGFTLQFKVDRPQPLVFNGNAIMNERWPYNPETGFVTEPIPSPTWYAAYEGFKRGENLALPYYDPVPSDANKLRAASDIYRSFRDGAISADEVPDLSDVYPDDPQTLAEIGFQTEPGATPAQALIQACGSCHNDVLDQSITRARFNIDLKRLERPILDRAIERMRLPLDDSLHMPPREFRQLDPGAVQPLIEYLAGENRSAEDDALLGSAAAHGMAQPLGGLPADGRATD